MRGFQQRFHNSHKNHNNHKTFNKQPAPQQKHSPLASKKQATNVTKQQQRDYEEKQQAQQQDTILLTQVLALQFISALLANEKTKPREEDAILAEQQDAASIADSVENEAENANVPMR